MTHTGIQYHEKGCCVEIEIACDRYWNTGGHVHIVRAYMYIAILQYSPALDVVDVHVYVLHAYTGIRFWCCFSSFTTYPPSHRKWVICCSGREETGSNSQIKFSISRFPPLSTPLVLFIIFHHSRSNKRCIGSYWGSIYSVYIFKKQLNMQIIYFKVNLFKNVQKITKYPSRAERGLWWNSKKNVKQSDLKTENPDLCTNWWREVFIHGRTETRHTAHQHKGKGKSTKVFSLLSSVHMYVPGYRYMCTLEYTVYVHV